MASQNQNSGISGPSLTKQHPVDNKEIEQIANKLETMANKGISGNPEYRGEITKKDTGKLVEGKPYIDKKNKVLVFKIGNELVTFAGTVIS